jgi:hypothetical protein
VEVARRVETDDLMKDIVVGLIWIMMLFAALFK